MFSASREEENGLLGFCIHRWIVNSTLLAWRINHMSTKLLKKRTMAANAEKQNENKYKAGVKGTGLTK